MNNKNNRMIQGAPVDLLALSRFQLASYVCSLRRAAQREVLKELEALEADHKRKGAGK